MLAPADGARLAPRHRPRVLEAFQVPSGSRPVTRTVTRLADGSWECDCEDWLYRRRGTGEDCKHIIWVRLG